LLDHLVAIEENIAWRGNVVTVTLPVCWLAESAPVWVTPLYALYQYLQYAKDN